MSEKSKGDTSSSALPPHSRIVKNPLLSASVTGITFDDFPNKPLLLPAAPPIIHAPPPPVLATGLMNRETKSLVTVGQPSDIDNETLSEINLNSNAEENQTPAALIDTNSNSLLEQTTNTDSILSQAATSFSALPSVASSVFSTFSKRIYSANTSRERTPVSEDTDPNANSISQLDIQPAYIQHSQHQQQQQQPQQQLFTQTPIAPPPFAANNYYAGPPHTAAVSQQVTQAQPLNNEPPPEPPKFYTPAEVPTLPTASAAAAIPPAGGQNTYRLSAKKKIYAPIPGFSDPNANQAAPTLDPTAIAAPIAFDSAQTQASAYGAYPQPVTFNPTQQHSYQPQTEERKGGGLFSITNLVPTGVLQNITGLVQSAAGTIAQTVKQDSTQQNSYHSQQQQQLQPQAQTALEINFFGGANFPTPTSTVPPPPGFLPQQTSQPIALAQSNFGTPYPTAAQQQLPTLPPKPNFFVPGAVVSPPPGFNQLAPPSIAQTAAKPPLISASEHSQPTFATNSVQFFDPTKVATVPYFDPTRPPNASSAEPIQAASKPDQTYVGFPKPVASSDTTGPPSVSSAAEAIVPPAQSAQTVFGAPPTATTTTVFDTSQPTSRPPTADAIRPPLQPAVAPTPIPIFDTTQQASSATTNSTPITFLDPSRPLDQSSAAEFKIPQFQPAVAQTPIQFIDPSRPLIQPVNITSSQLTTASFFDTTRPQVQTAPPGFIPHASVSLPPINVGQPPATGAPSSFRLQKGTRLYKNPLTSAETVPAAPLAQQPLGQPPVTPQSIFNPFGAANTSLEQSPALFIPEEKPTAHQKNQQPIGFFNPAASVTSATLLSAVDSEIQNTGQQQHLSDIQSADTNRDASDSALTSSCPTVQNKLTDNTIQTNANKVNTEDVESTVDFTNVEHNSNLSIEPVFEASAQPASSDSSQKKASNQDSSDPLDKTLQQLLSEETNETNAANFLPPPPQLNSAQGTSNPYRKDLTATHTATPANASAQPSLANYFTPIGSDNSKSGNDFNFFATSPASSAANLFHQPKLNSESKTTSAAFFFETQAPTAPTESETTVQGSSLPQLPPQTCIAPPPLFKEAPSDTVESSVQHRAIAPPLGFDNIVSAVETELATASALTPTESFVASTEKVAPTTQQPAAVNSVSNFFDKTSNIQNSEITTTSKQPNPTSFFDTFAAASSATTDISTSSVPSVALPNQLTTLIAVPTTKLGQQQQANEDQRIQNFFNNPPPQDLSGSIGDLNYDLVHAGLTVKELQTRSLTPASNLVEPPSSSCSDFSELNNSLIGQRQSNATDNPNKSTTEAENKISPSEESVSTTTNSKTELKADTFDLAKHYEDLPEEILQELRMANLLIGEKAAASAPPTTALTYTPAVKHWFYKRLIGNKVHWTPFSHYDSALLETSLITEDEVPNLVAVEGGRYDVNIRERTKSPVYWESVPTEVRRCSWFYKAVDSRYVPYEEEIAEQLEEEYKLAAERGEWHKKIIISLGEQVVFHGPTVIVHFQQQQNSDAWGGSSQSTTRPRVVKRDLEDFTIEQGESQRVDHLLLMVHGIGAACDLKMRSVEEVVDEFRAIGQQLVASHYKNSTEMGLVGRVEILPISWHSHLHSVEMGIDEKLKSITLESIPKLRNFANDTLLDVLFYTSPTYCQKIMNTVAVSMNAVYAKYRERHPEFSGGVSLAGHSLGSLILFDLLCHQNPNKECVEQNMENPDQQCFPTTIGSNQLASTGNDNKQISYTMGPAGTGQPFINYEQLLFQPKKFFAMGSPIGVFVTIRGIDKLGLDFRLPTCPGFYNIFHPFDPVAYRIEALVNPDMTGIRPVLIPHHKGRKRMHLELRETMTRVGADLKQRFFDTFKNTLDSVNFLGTTSSSRGNKANEAKESMEKEVDKVLEMQMQFDQQHEEDQQNQTAALIRPRSDSNSTSLSETDMVEVDFPLGKLNDSKRVDYVLQEAPLEFFNEYLFALSSHVCYWESEDTILFVMKEIYSGLGISPDSQVPQQSMTIERPSSSNKNSVGTTPTLATPSP